MVTRVVRCRILRQSASLPQGQHIVTLTVESNNGCIDSTTASVEVYDTPDANFGVFNVCEDALASFLDSSTVGYGGSNQ